MAVFEFGSEAGFEGLPSGVDESLVETLVETPEMRAAPLDDLLAALAAHVDCAVEDKIIKDATEQRAKLEDW